MAKRLESGQERLNAWNVDLPHGGGEMNRRGVIAASREHLSRNRMTYLSHMRFASSHGAICIRAGLMLMIHSVLPGVYRTAGADLLRRLRKVFTA